MAFKFSKRKKFSGSFPAGDVVTPQYQSGVAVVNSVVAEDVVAERQYPYGSVFYFNADTSTENELAEFGNAFSSSVLGPQYCRQADGSYVDTGDGVPVDVWDGHNWVRSSGAVTNLLPSGYNDMTALSWTKRGTCVVSAGNLVSGLRSPGSSGGDVYRSITGVTPSSSLGFYCRVKRVSKTGQIEIANPIDGAYGRYRIDLSKLGDDWEELTKYHPAVTIITEFKSFTDGRVGIHIYAKEGTDLSVYLDGFLLTPTLSSVPYTPPGTTMPASNASLSAGTKFSLHPSTDLYKALAGKTDGVELLPENGLRNTNAWTLGTGWVLNEGTARFSGATGATLTTALTASLPANTRVRATFELAVTAQTSLSLSVAGSAAKTVTTSGQHILDFTTTAGGTDLTLTAADGSDLVMYGLTLQKIQPATCTVAAVCKVGAGTGDRAILACNPEAPITGSLLHSSGSNPRQSVMSSDGKTVASFTGTSTTTGDYHLKIVQTSADGSMFRVGNKQLGVEAFIKWSDWTIFDGSFDPNSIFSLGFNAQAPVWFNKIAVWDEYVSDEQIVDALWYTDTKLQQFLDTGIGEATFRFKMRTDRAALPTGEVFRPLNNDMIQFHNTGTTGRFVFGDGDASRSEDIDWNAGDTVVLAVQADGFAFRIYELRVVPEDVKLLWPREYSDAGVQKSLVGPNPEWAYAGPQYAEDGKYIGYNEPVDLNGDGQLWWSGPGYANLTPNSQFNGKMNAPNGTTPPVVHNDVVYAGERCDAIIFTPTNDIKYAGSRCGSLNYTTYPASTPCTCSLHIALSRPLQGDESLVYYWAGNGSSSYFIIKAANSDKFVGTFVRADVSLSASGGPIYPVIFLDKAVLSDITVYVCKAQLTATTSPMPYVATGASPVTVNQIPNYAPAIHGDKGVWCGPSYANLLPSGAEDLSSWDKIQANVASAGLPTPYGGEAYRISATSAAAGHRVYKRSSGSAPGTYTVSGLVKKDTTRYVVVTLSSSTETTRTSAIIDFNLKKINLADGTGQVALEELRDGWFLYTITGAVIEGDGLATTFIYVRNNSGDHGYTGDGESVLAGEIQITQTAYPMPYVPPGTTVTSAAGTSGGNGIGFPLETALKECFEKNETDGVELVTNGGFNTDTSGWVGRRDDTLAIESGRCKITLAAEQFAGIESAVGIPTIPGATYVVTVEAYPGTYSGQVLIVVGGIGWGATNTAYGVKTFRFTATSKSHVVGVSAYTTIDAGKTFYVDNISVQRLKPATCTVAAEVTMGVGSGDMSWAQISPVVTVTNTNDQYHAMVTYSCAQLDGSTYVSRGRDGVQTILVQGTWSRNERHLKIVQTNADASQFRVGNLCVGIDSTIQWGSWATFDGSFNPLTHLRLAYGSAVPLWFRKVMVSDKGGMSDEEILARLEA